MGLLIFIIITISVSAFIIRSFIEMHASHKRESDALWLDIALNIKELQKEQELFEKKLQKLTKLKKDYDK
jgi:hypothetical protein